MSTIIASVGRGGANQKKDVRKVQHLLNRFRHPGDPLLKVDGVFGFHTAAAIEHFQRDKVHLAHVDVRVDPHGPTLHRLGDHPDHNGSLGPEILSRRPASVPSVAGSPAASHRTQTLSLPTQPAAPLEAAPQPHAGSIAWGSKVSPAFKAKAIAISERLQISPDYLMSCMAFESGESFSSIIRNAAGSGAIGLIQFMPKTAEQLKTSTHDLSKMSPEAQLDYVEKYFAPHAGKLHSIEDIYMTILFPKAIGKDIDYVLFKSGTKAFDQNKGLDRDCSGTITVREAANAVRLKYNKGLKPGFFG